MKNLFLFALLVMALAFQAQAQPNYIQFEVGYMTPKSEHRRLVEKNIGAHAKKYHTADPYKMFVFDVVTGPHSGSYFLGLGPVTFTQLDNRPSSPEHDADWQNNVQMYLEKEEESAYWRLDTALSYRPAGGENFGKSRLRWYTLYPDQFDRYMDAISKVNKVYKAKNYKAGWSLYTRYGASAGPHVCTEINFDNWAYLDTPNTFAKDFDDVYGDGAYDRFIEELELSVDMSKTYDELIVFNPEMSSPE